MAVRKRNRIRSKGRKSTWYEAEVYVNGVRVAFKAFDTRAAAESWHDKTRDALASNEIPEEEQTCTVGDCIARFVQDRLPELRIQTSQAYEARIGYLSSSPLAAVKIRDLTDMAIDRWFAWLKKHPTAKDPKRKNFRQEFNLLRAILNWHRNTADAKFVVPIVKRHRKMIYYKIVKPRRPDYFIRQKDVVPWVEWLRVHQPIVYSRLGKFQVLTSARVGEAAGVCWDCVDLDNEIVTITRTIVWDYKTKMPLPDPQDVPKTDESVRIVKLSPPLVALFREVWDEQRSATGKDPTGLVFRDPKTNGPLHYRRIQYAYDRGFMKLGLPWRSTHICRHTFGTLALVANRDLSAVQAAMGHRRREETEGYAKVVALIDGATVKKTSDFIGFV